MANASLVRGTAAGISNVPLKDGQILFDVTNKNMLLDVKKDGSNTVERFDFKTVPIGGTAGQVLKKVSNTDRDVAWATLDTNDGYWTVAVQKYTGDESAYITNSAIRTTSTIDAYCENASGKPVNILKTNAYNGGAEIFFDPLEENTKFKLWIR